MSYHVRLSKVSNINNMNSNSDVDCLTCKEINFTIYQMNIVDVRGHKDVFGPTQGLI